MDLPNLKELRAILKLCREQGVSDITVGNVAIKFGELPRERMESDPVTTSPEVSSLMPSAEEMAYWSSQPDPLDGVSQ